MGGEYLTWHLGSLIYDPPHGHVYLDHFPAIYMGTYRGDFLARDDMEAYAEGHRDVAD